MSRGRASHTKNLITASHEILEEIAPATVRAVCYKLFVAKLIASMAKNETNKISRILARARERGEIPWEWIVDDSREPERVSAWNSPQTFAQCVINSYRRDYWDLQHQRVEVWSEKATIRGTLRPVLDEYGVTFRVMHGYGSSTAVKQIADESSSEPAPLIALYVGDWDPSGLHMSAVDLPRRLSEYGAVVMLSRIALTDSDANRGLPQFAVEEKCSDPRYRWFRENYGERCFELDALDPNELRQRVESHIAAQIDFDVWNRCKSIEAAEHESLIRVIGSWGAT